MPAWDVSRSAFRLLRFGSPIPASPGKRQQLAEKAVRKTVRFATYLSDVVSDPAFPPCIEPLPQDYRFQSETWQQWPFNLLEQG
jgi:polyhydroxyalkanoate synthase